jgi:hypothetical protein
MRAALAAGAALAVLATTAGPSLVAGAATVPVADCGTRSGAHTVHHIAVVVFENKPLNKIIGNTADAPYLNSLAKACSYSKNMWALSPTSLANYVALTSGYTGCRSADTSGTCTAEKLITSNADPSVWPQPNKSIFELLDAADPGSAVQWAESSPTNCPLTSSGSNFIINHAPFAYYTRTQQNLCKAWAKPFTSGSGDQLSGGFNLIIPNRIDIMHLAPNTTIAQRIQNGDRFAKAYIPYLMSQPEYTSGDAAIIIVWDEGNAKTENVPFIVVSPYTQAGGISSTPRYDHFSTLKGIQTLLGPNALPLLGHAGDTGKTSVADDPLFGLK